MMPALQPCSEDYEIGNDYCSNKLVAYVDTPYSYQVPATQDQPVGLQMNPASKGLSLSNTGIFQDQMQRVVFFPITVANRG